VVTGDDFLERLAIALDRYANVPDDVLWEIVTRDGACMWFYANERAPDWTGADLTDRELAARICQNCTVQLGCLELELRTVGANTLGVWGALSEDDRRALYPLWLARRAGRTPDGGEQP
jgi:WhiB family transcriptional regulator, redox-sensing transcriptional regulator